MATIGNGARLNAQQATHQEGIALKTELAEADEVKAIAESAQKTESDLLVLGIPRRYPYQNEPS